MVCIRLVVKTFPCVYIYFTLRSAENFVNSCSAPPMSMNIIKPKAMGGKKKENVRNFDVKMAIDEPLCSCTPSYEKIKQHYKLNFYEHFFNIRFFLFAF